LFGYQKHRRSQKWFPQTWGTIGEVCAGVPPAAVAVAVAVAVAAFSHNAGS
jgi:hypothetical protein